LRPLARFIEFIYAKKKHESVARFSLLRTPQRWVIMIPPSMKAEQNRPVRVNELVENFAVRVRVAACEQRHIPFRACFYIVYRNNGLCSYHYQWSTTLSRLVAFSELSSSCRSFPNCFIIFVCYR